VGVAGLCSRRAAQLPQPEKKTASRAAGTAYTLLCTPHATRRQTTRHSSPTTGWQELTHSRPSRSTCATARPFSGPSEPRGRTVDSAISPGRGSRTGARRRASLKCSGACPLVGKSHQLRSTAHMQRLNFSNLKAGLKKYGPVGLGTYLTISTSLTACKRVAPVWGDRDALAPFASPAHALPAAQASSWPSRTTWTFAPCWGSRKVRYPSKVPRREPRRSPLLRLSVQPQPPAHMLTVPMHTGCVATHMGGWLP
jgi:hypothetical protein